MFDYMVGKLHHQLLRLPGKQERLYGLRLRPLSTWITLLKTWFIVGHKVSFALDVAIRLISLKVRGKPNQ
jgi:hypothetical protein